MLTTTQQSTERCHFATGDTHARITRNCITDPVGSRTGNVLYLGRLYPHTVGDGDHCDIDSRTTRPSGSVTMPSQKIIAILLIVAGVLALAYGGFSYTKQTHEANVGGLHLSIDEKQHVNVPVWAGVGALLIGGLLLVGKKN